jgi:hypothetical protein
MKLCRSNFCYVTEYLPRVHTRTFQIEIIQIAKAVICFCDNYLFRGLKKCVKRQYIPKFSDLFFFVNHKTLV